MNLKKQLAQFRGKNKKVKQDSFLKFNYKKLLLFFALLVFIPIPFSCGLAEGVAPLISALLPMLIMGVSALVYLKFIGALFFLGQAAIYLFIEYSAGCLIYKLLYFIKKENKNVPWLHIFIVIALLYGVFLFAHFANIISVSA